MKMFEGKDFSADILPIEKFRLFSGEEYSCEKLISSCYLPEIFEEANCIVAKGHPPVLPASLYRMFVTNGNRIEFEDMWFDRANNLFVLFMANLVDKSGKYFDSFLDYLWAVLEQTSWILPAHLNHVRSKPHDENASDQPFQLPPFSHKDADFVDLFSAQLGAELAMIHHFLGDVIEKEVPKVLMARIEEEIQRQVLRPFLNDDHYWWMGHRREKLNNWTPWIVSNVLTCAALLENDLEKRRFFAEKCIRIVDKYNNSLPDDGACEEGAGYWNVAGGAVFNFLEVLNDLTGGKRKKDLFTHPLLHGMCDYRRKVNIFGTTCINFADCSKNAGLSWKSVFRWGRAMGDERIVSFAAAHKQYERFNKWTGLPYQLLRNKLDIDVSGIPQYVPDPFCYTESLQIAVMRAGELVCAAKGGTNGEGHGHNDVGSFVLYRKESPVFIDPGVETYCKDTFSQKRFELWPMRSSSHNLPAFGGVEQKNGEEFAALNSHANAEEKSFECSLEKAYPDEAGLISYKRLLRAMEETVLLTDCIEINEEKDVCFNFISLEIPKAEDGKWIFSNAEVTFTKGFEFSHDEIRVDSKLEKEWEQPVIFRLKLTKRMQVGKFEMMIK